MKKKILIPIIIILILIIGSAVYYFTPKTFCKGVDPTSVAQISVFDGQTGQGFTIDDPSAIEYIVENIQSHPMKRDNISLGRMGYRFKISFIGSNGKDVVPLFVINSDDSIRKDPFFYRCDGGLCVDYLYELETELK